MEVETRPPDIRLTNKEALTPVDVVIGLAFVFLLAVLTWHGFGRYWQQVDARHKQILFTTQNIVQRFELLVEADHRLGTVLIRALNPELIAIERSRGSSKKILINQLQDELRNGQLGFEGFVIFDQSGELLVSDHELPESSLTSLQLLLNDYDPSFRYLGIFDEKVSWLTTVLTYNNQDNEQRYFGYYRSYSSLISRLNYVGSNHFKLILVDRATGKFPVQNQPVIHTSGITDFNSKHPAISVRIPITNTPWDMVAIKTDPYHLDIAIRSAGFAVGLLGLFFLAAALIRRRLKYFKAQQSKTLQLTREKEQRAQLAIAAIDEAVFYTDEELRILFVNESALDMLCIPSEFAVLGLEMEKVVKFEDPLWASRFDPFESAKTFRQSFIQNSKHHSVQLTCYPQTNDPFDHSLVWVVRDQTIVLESRQEAERNQNLYQGLFDSSGVGFWVVSLEEKLNEEGVLQVNFILSEINQAALNLAKAKNKKMLSNGMNYFLKGRTQLYQNLISDAIKNNKSKLNVMVEALDFDGMDRFFWVSIGIVKGSLNKVFLSFIDATDEITATRKLSEQKEFWSKILETVPDWLYVKRLSDGAELYSNNKIFEILGFSASQARHFKGVGWFDLIHPEDRPSVMNLRTQLTQSSSDEVLESTLRFKSVSNEWITVRLREKVFESDGEGIPISYIGSARDITHEILTQAKIVESEQRYALLAANINDVIWSVDLDANLTYVSPSVERVFHLSQKKLVQRSGKQIKHWPGFDEITPDLQNFLAKAKQNLEKFANSRNQIDVVIDHKMGEQRVIELSYGCLIDKSGKLQGLAGIARDVTEQRKAEEEMKLAASVFDNISESIVVSNSDGTIERANDAFSDMTGFEEREVLGQKVSQFLAEPLSSEQNRQVEMDLNESGYWQGEVNYIHKTKEQRPALTGVSAIKSDQEKIERLIYISSDISERKRTERHIHNLAYFDPLTGLPNRSQMQEVLEKLLSSGERAFGLLYIDLDRFKPINDSMGHQVGDQVLQEVASRLLKVIPPEQFVARLGGDEFLVILNDFQNHQAVADASIEISERILHRIVEAFETRERELFISASIGISIYPNDGVTGVDLLRNADTAMYHAKAIGKNTFQFYSDHMNAQALERLELENDLYYALERNEMVVVFQPQWHNGKGRISGVETLLRWRRNGSELISPDKFIPIIEDTGLIIPVGKWVLEQACKNYCQWRDEGLLVDRIAVNVSAKQFASIEFLSTVERVLKEQNMPPDGLEIELTESVLIDDIERTISTLQSLKQMGVLISIDDFGTGYSSLSYLKQFPLDKLKIDRAFVKNLPHNIDDVQITRTIVDMAKNLGMEVIAEGVETVEQKEFLTNIGCDEIQGFLFSHPVSAEEIRQIFSKA